MAYAMGLTDLNSLLWLFFFKSRETIDREEET
jgi:hypothetical protein